MSNLLKDTHPHLSEEWDIEKNNELGLSLDMATYGSNKKVWWKCRNKHSWDTTPKSRTKQGTSCPYCSNKKTLVGYNDLRTTKPDIARSLLNKEDGYKYTEIASAKVDWKCEKCNNISRGKHIHLYCQRGVFCPHCSKESSFPERIMNNLLTENNIEYIQEKEFEWLEDRKYDFYLPDYNLIIETHGAHHYRESYRGMEKHKTLEYIQNEDRIKRETAIENGIVYYIEIDCSEPHLFSVKESIENHQEFNNIININKNTWKQVATLTSNDDMKKCWSLWDEGLTSNKKIVEKTGLDTNMVLRYLKHGEISGLCSYTVEDAKRNGTRRRRKVIQKSLEGEYIKTWNSVVEAGRAVGLKSETSIVGCCRGKMKTSGGFMWEYAEEECEYVQKM